MSIVARLAVIGQMATILVSDWSRCGMSCDWLPGGGPDQPRGRGAVRGEPGGGGGPAQGEAPPPPPASHHVRRSVRAPPRYSTVQYSTVQCSTVQYSTVQYTPTSPSSPCPALSTCATQVQLSTNPREVSQWFSLQRSIKPPVSYDFCRQLSSVPTSLLLTVFKRRLAKCLIDSQS